MKRILITGANSYIGLSFEDYIKMFGEDYSVDVLDMESPDWVNTDFSPYDSVFHVAGIAHSDSGDVPKDREKLYIEVNTDLAVKTAERVKSCGVKQFIFMSSIIVYGTSAPIGHDKVINKDTVPIPENCYGRSKLEAERQLEVLADDNFKIVVLRPPMIYGKNSKGNYPILSKLARKLPVFPDISNMRSTIYIENFCEFVRLMIENEEQGIFFPQNSEYISTSEMGKAIAAVYGKNLRLTRIFNPALKVLRLFYGTVDKAFGGLCYEKSMSEYKEPYCKYSFEESIKLTES